jgi:oligosaccharide repeat unit polymerase
VTGILRKLLWHPMLILLLIWTVNLSGHILFPQYLGLVSVEVFCLVSIFLCSFSTAYLFFRPIFAFDKRKISSVFSPIKTKKFLAVLIALFATLFLMLWKIIELETLKSPQDYRSYVITSFAAKNDFFWILFSMSGVFFIFCYRYMHSKRLYDLNLVLAFLLSLPFSGRNYLLFLMIFLCFKFFSVYRPFRQWISFWLVCLILVGVASIPVVLFDKAPKDAGVFLGSLHSYLHYFFVPLSGLSWIVDQGGDFGDLMLFSNGFKAMLSQNLGFNFSPIFDMPYSPGPFVTNVYTVLWPSYYDLGWLGVLFLGVFLGTLYSWVGQFGRNIGRGSYLYAALLYPLVMTVFHDTFFSSIGLWLLVSLPLLIDWFLISLFRLILKKTN